MSRSSAPALGPDPMPIRRRALADDAYEALTALIMDHAIAPDSRLNIESLARSLEVSPTPVREALSRLESDGLVIKEALKGYRTAPILSRGGFDELFELRQQLEPWAAAQAAVLHTGNDARDLRAELKAAPLPHGTEYADYKALAEHDRAFHLLIFRIARNSLIEAVFERTRCHLHLFRLSFRLSMASSPVVEHAAVVEAILKQDPAAARAAMAAHLDASHARIAVAIDADLKEINAHDR